MGRNDGNKPCGLAVLVGPLQRVWNIDDRLRHLTAHAPLTTNP
jgi:hypothetical protein